MCPIHSEERLQEPVPNLVSLTSCPPPAPSSRLPHTRCAPTAGSLELALTSSRCYLKHLLTRPSLSSHHSPHPSQSPHPFIIRAHIIRAHTLPSTPYDPSVSLSQEPCGSASLILLTACLRKESSSSGKAEICLVLFLPHPEATAEPGTWLALNKCRLGEWMNEQMDKGVNGWRYRLTFVSPQNTCVESSPPG